MRLIDYLEIETSGLIEHARRLEREGYYNEDVGALARNAAALWERTLKACDAAWLNNRSMMLDAMCRDLDSRGWQHEPQVAIFMRAANRDKHAAWSSHDLRQIRTALEAAQQGLQSLPAVLPGILAAIPDRLRIRRIVCAVYEFFHSGETLYSFLSAGPDDTWQSVRHLDDFQVENRHQKEVEARLASLKDWVINPPELNGLKVSLEESDHELWMIAEFTASYQEILELMAPYQHNLPLLPGLHREDDVSNMVASAAAAALAGQATSGLTPRSAGQAPTLERRVSDLLSKVPNVPGATSVDRCDVAAFEANLSDALVADEELGLLVTKRGLVLVRT